jgi:hypothetical protein
LWQTSFGIAPASWFEQPVLCHKRGDSASLSLYSIVNVRNLG